MSTLLIPLDGSALGEDALSYVTEHVPKEGVIILLMHCMDFNYVYADTNLAPAFYLDLEADERKRNEEYLQARVAEVKLKGFNARSVLAQGDPVRQILAVAKGEAADQIVLSTHGRSGLSRFFIGSVAEGVIRRATVPVLVVPSQARLKEDSDPIVPGVTLP